MKLKKIMSVALLATGLSGGVAFASDVEKGSDLQAACQALLSGYADQTAQAERCKVFMVSMIRSQEQEITIGEPFRAQRLGASGEETVCFEVPKKLTYRDFAQEVVSHATLNSDEASRGAVELAARALAKRYPCSPERSQPKPPTP